MKMLPSLRDAFHRFVERLREETDPWRRTVGLGLRSEASKFALAAFGLDTASAGELPEHEIATRLGKFLRGEPDVYYALRHGRFCVERVRVPQVDVVVLGLRSSGEMHSFSFQPDPHAPLHITLAQRHHAEDAILRSYNATREAPESRRPQPLLKKVKQEIWLVTEGREARRRLLEFALRVLSAVCLSFELSPVTEANRFTLPDFRLRRSLAFGPLHIVCRRVHGSSSIDLWMQVHHAAADGAAMSEVLDRLVAEWGTIPNVNYPADDPDAPPAAMIPCHTSIGERPVHLITDFLDFTPLMEIRRDLSAEYGIQIPLSGLLVWCLGHQPEFVGRKFSVAVDLPAAEGHERAVDLVAIRAADFFQCEQPLTAFAEAFNELVEMARHRATQTLLAMRRLAGLPRFAGAFAVQYLPGISARTFGTIGLSVLKGVPLFVGPIADAGFEDGFLAIGNVELPDARGGNVGAVSIKGQAAVIARYPRALRRAIATCIACCKIVKTPAAPDLQ
jgi:hypothetical protein